MKDQFQARIEDSFCSHSSARLSAPGPEAKGSVFPVPGLGTEDRGEGSSLYHRPVESKARPRGTGVRMKITDGSWSTLLPGLIERQMWVTKVAQPATKTPLELVLRCPKTPPCPTRRNMSQWSGSADYGDFYDHHIHEVKGNKDLYLPRI